MAVQSTGGPPPEAIAAINRFLQSKGIDPNQFQQKEKGKSPQQAMTDLQRLGFQLQPPAGVTPPSGTGTNFNAVT